MRISCPVLCYLFVCAMASATAVNADSLQDAKRLLRVTDMGKQFDATALQQTRNIIRTYSSIVSTSANHSLPQHIKHTIASCYERTYAWENFEAGIAQILADNFSRKEMRLLIDFYRNRGLSPLEIQSFKSAIAKGKAIQQISAEYIFSHSDGCVDRDAKLIIEYLNNSRRNSEHFAAE